MSKLNEKNSNNNEIEKEVITSEQKIINKNYLLKAKSSIKEELNSFYNKNEEIQFKLPNTKRIIKSDQIQFKKLNSNYICNNFTLKKEPQRKINSEEERFKKIKKKFSERNNNINERVKIFVPAKEYLDLLEELDEEENEEMNNIINNVEINDNSEDKKLNNCIINRIFSASNKFNSEKNDVVKKNDLNKNQEISDRKQNIIIDKHSFIYDIHYEEEKIQKKGKNIKSNNDKNNFREKIQSKFLKNIEDNYTTLIPEIYFKYGEYESDVNKYDRCSLLIINNCLYILKQGEKEILNKKDMLINNLKNYINVSSPLLLFIDFDLLSCILLINKNKSAKEFQIKILGTHKSFSFVLKDEKEYNKYIYLIGGIIYNSEGHKHNQLGLSLRKDILYNEIYVTPSNFELTAKTGDLLLFKSIDTCADLQRLYTCDNYDHVGIVYKENNRIKIFESTSIGKCSPLDWHYFKLLLFNLVYNKIAFRQLIYDNGDKDKVIENQNIIEEKCKNFFREIEGKNYYLSITNFLCCQKPEEYEYDKKFQESKGFCCSALAAALYIKIGVAKLQKSIHSTKPGDFEQIRNKICFEKDYFLGPEKILDFSG